MAPDSQPQRSHKRKGVYAHVAIFVKNCCVIFHTCKTFRTLRILDSFYNSENTVYVASAILKWRDLENVFLYIFILEQLIEEVGFSNVKAIDNTTRFIEVLKSERTRLETEKGTFMKVYCTAVNMFPRRRAVVLLSSDHMRERTVVM